MLNDTINLLKILLNEISKFSISFFERFKDLFIFCFDKLFNGKNYKYFISFVLIFIAILIYYLTNNVFFDLNKYEEIEKIESQLKNDINNFSLKEKKDEIYNILSNNTKNANLLIILCFTFLLILFYFFVYRNDSPALYNSANKTLKKDYTGNKNSSYARKNEFNINNIIFSLTDPIKNLFLSFFYITGTILFIVILLSIIFYSFYIGNNSYNIFKLILQILILIVLLSLIAYGLNLHKNKDDKCFDDNITYIENILCIIKYLIFFIPCLLTIFIEKLNNDIKLTPSPVYILFFLLILLITMIFILPILYKNILNANKHNLIKDNKIYYLNKRRVIGKYQHLNNEENKYFQNNKTYSLFEKNDDVQYNLETTLNSKPKINNNKYSYSISFYLYINPQDINTNYSYNKDEGAVLFNYGSKPIILYNGKKQQIIIKSEFVDNNNSNQNSIIFKSKDKKYGNVDFKFQKWNYFVINYENNIIDVFINGELVASKKNNPDFSTNDEIVIGEDNGIHGSIKDIQYYNNIQPKNKIEFLYNLIKN